jgi:hypothetical protein
MSPERRRKARTSEFTRGRLVVGIVLVAAVGAGAAFFIGRSRGGPDPGSIVYASPQGVYVHDLETGHDRRALRLPSGTAAAIPSPDGRWVAYSKGAGEVWLASLVSDDKPYQVAERFVIPLGWSPDGKLLTSELLGDRDLVLVDPEGDRETLASGAFPAISVPVWLDDHRVALAAADDQFVLIDTTGPSQSPPTAGTPLAASPDGAELLVAREGVLFVSKMKSDEPVGLRVIFEGNATQAAASSEGYLAISAKDKKGKSGVWIFEGGDKSQKVVSGKVSGVAWSARGAALLYERKGALYALQRPGAEPKRVSRKGVTVFPLLSFAVVP